MEYEAKPRKEGGLGPVDIPIIGDVSKDIGNDYGVIVKEGDRKSVV